MLYTQSNEKDPNRDWLKAQLANVDWDIKEELNAALEKDAEAWRDLLGVIPFNGDLSIDILRRGYSLVNPSLPASPAKILLQMLEYREVTIKSLISWLEMAGLEPALLVLKPDEPLEIIEEPEDVEVEAGMRIQITCRARGFPTPLYQWFRNDDELRDEVFDTLLIEKANLDDSGVYRCQVYVIDRETEEVRDQILFSRPCQIMVLDPPPPQQQYVGIKPKIQEHPRSPGEKLPHGVVFSLQCRATGDPPLQYKWFKDGVEIPGEENSSLKFNHLLPDLDGKICWEFFCLVSNGWGSAASNSTLVGLKRTDEDYYARDKVALLIGNEKYQRMVEFKSPSSDVATLAAKLKEMEFRVWAYVDLTQKEMYNAVKHFCAELDKGSYGLFYFAGHGFAKPGESYMQPIEAEDEYKVKESLSSNFVASEMQKYNPALSVLLLDMCRERPPPAQYNERVESQRSPEQTRKYKNTIIGYATSFLGEAGEVVGQTNGLYVKYLKHHLAQKKAIHKVLNGVNRDMNRDPMANRLGQEPWIEHGLKEFRSLCDPIINDRPNNLAWQQVYLFPEPVQFRLGSYILDVFFKAHKGAICNAMDMTLRFRCNRSIAQGQAISLRTIFYPEAIKYEKKWETASKSMTFVLRDLQNINEPMRCKLILTQGGQQYASEYLHLGTPRLSFLQCNTFEEEELSE